jgi:thiol-disulfide isomerase/thioredoxin
MSSWKLFAVVASLAIVGCSPPPVVTDAGSTQDSGVIADAGTVPTDTGTAPEDTGVACMPTPTTNFCSAENCNFRDVALPDCDEGGGDYRFYGGDFCTTQVTLLVIAAGWCVPCQMEAPMIQQLITDGMDGDGVPYAGRVRVINVYGQNPDYSAPTFANCRIWKNRYHITAHMVTDPMGISQIYFPNQAFPSNMLIDRHGVIRYRAYGTSTGLSALRAQIDALLAE